MVITYLFDNFVQKRSLGSVLHRAGLLIVLAVFSSGCIPTATD